MKKKNIFLLSSIICILASILLFSCKKESELIEIPPSPTLENLGDSLPPHVLEIVDQMHDAEIDPCMSISATGRPLCEAAEEIYGMPYDMYKEKLLNGTLFEYKTSYQDPYENFSSLQTWEALIANMTTVARHLSEDQAHQYSYEGALSPAQNGLAYVYGSKNFTTRKNALAWGSCPENLYGLDCSGYLYHMFKGAGIDFPVGSAIHQKNTNTLLSAFSHYPSTSNFVVQNLGRINEQNLWVGDIIYWSRLDGITASHIGFITRDNNNNAYVFQSNGSHSNNCSANYGSQRGPRAIDLYNGYWFSSDSDWEIIRITPESSPGCANFDIDYIWDAGAAGNQYTMFASGGVPPYQYSFNFGSFTSNNVFFTSILGPHVCTARDAQGCETTIAL
jgi:cell wall-associated NlpC family hydrolase